MITIPVRVCGDVWCDPEAFCTALQESNLKQPISIDLRAEGPSVAALGILAELRSHCDKTGRDPDSIQLINAPNNVEITEFRNCHTGRSHFFSMSTRYWRSRVPTCDQANRFAMFVGRTTVARCSIMYELYHDHDLNRHFKFSTMNYNGSPIWNPYPGWRVIEQSDHWLGDHDFQKMTDWWQTSRPTSLDQKRVQDQYSPDHNTNLSLLDHYVHFHTELVTETYTLGHTFFPTEKTVRPIMAAKPFMIYAAPGFLEHLRNLGFETYHDFWDESYDHYEGPDRWMRIKTSIQDLCAMDHDQFLALMRSASRVALHNRGVLADMVLTEKINLLQDTRS